MANFTVVRGDNATYKLTFTDGTDPIDITGYTLFFTVKPECDNANDDTSAVIQKTVTSFSDPTGGIGEITLMPADTDVTPGKYKYDFQFKTDTGEIQTIETGFYTIVDDVTKRTT